MPVEGGVRTRGSIANITPANITRHTPYNKRVFSLHTVRKGVRNRDNLGVLGDLLKVSWSAYSVSPLFTWSNRTSKLKRYARRMSEFLTLYSNSPEEISLKASYQIVENLRLNKNDNSALEITVRSIKPTEDEDVSRCVFRGYLLSWGMPSSVERDDLDGSPFLPLLICSGLKRIAKQVCRSLENIHDCIISPLELHEMDIKEFGMALLSLIENKDDLVNLTYVIPNQPRCGSLKLTISSKMASKLGSLVLERCGREYTIQDVELFWNEISEYVYSTYCVKIKLCELVKLQLAHSSITGKTFRANNVKAMHVILFYLTYLSAPLESAMFGSAGSDRLK